MLNTRQNFHNSKLPKIGEVCQLPKNLFRTIKPGKVIVESFPLCDNQRPYSLGIHTVIVRRLDNGKKMQIAGFWLVNY